MFRVIVQQATYPEEEKKLSHANGQLSESKGVSANILTFTHANSKYSTFQSIKYFTLLIQKWVL